MNKIKHSLPLIVALTMLVARASESPKLAAPAPVPAAPVVAVDTGPSFRLDVEPVFFRAGCNSGGCHGAARGKDGFRLSLFGYDPAGDYFRLTQQMAGRRVNLAAPEESLLLTKATGKVPHTGGELFKVGSENYNTILKWLDAGALDDKDDVPVPTALAIVPDKFVFSEAGKKLATKVIASYSNGTSRDVTRLALFVSNNKSSADVNPDGLITSGKPGDTHVFARFGKFTIGTEVIVLPQEKDYKWPDSIKANNYIDELVHAKLQKLHVIPSDVCTDEQFVRRAYIDLIGLPPSATEYRGFLASTDAGKRAKLIDTLLARDEFADLWATKWSEWVKLRGEANAQLMGAEKKSALLYFNWIREQFKNNSPLDKFVRDQAAATGSNFDSPAANFFTMIPAANFEPKQVAQDYCQVLTGVRIQCAECHNHPFDRWTQDDYYSLVSFFTGLRRKAAADQREVYVSNDNNAAPAKHLLDGRLMPPKFLGGEAPDVKGKDARVALATWLTAPGNPLFRNNMANRVWEHFFGRGIVEPIDDFRISNPPSNRELLEELGKHLADRKFDLKALIRDICNSRTYQLSPTVNKTNRDDDRQFSHASMRRLRADVFLDALSLATDTTSKFNNLPRGQRAMQIYEGGRRAGSYFLKTFGMATRETVCACETRTEPTFAQALHLINGDTIQNKLNQSTVVEKLIGAKKNPSEIIDEMYVRALSRKPSPAESHTMLDLIGENPTRKAYDDVFWALLNSTEFAFNH